MSRIWRRNGKAIRSGGKAIRCNYCPCNGYAAGVLATWTPDGMRTFFACGTASYSNCSASDWHGGRQEYMGRQTLLIHADKLVYGSIEVPINRDSSLVPGETEPFAAYYPSGMTGYEFQRLSPYFNTQAELTAWINEEAATLEDRLNQWREYYYGKYYIAYINQHHIRDTETSEWNDCGYSYWENRSWDRKTVALHVVRIPPKEAELGFPDAASCAFSENAPQSYEYNGCNWEYRYNEEESYDTVFKIYGGFDNLEELRNLLISIYNSSENIGRCYGYVGGWLDGTVEYIWEQEVYESMDSSLSYTWIPDHWEFDNIEAALAPYKVQT